MGHKASAGHGALRDMLGAAFSETFLVALVNAVLFALWAVLPALFVGYTRQTISARRIRTDFSLRNLEAIELDRAILLYEKVSNCLKEIDRQGEDAKASLLARYRLRAQIKQQYGNELKDLQAYAHHLRTTIIRLREVPIQRFRSWVHIISAHFALGRSLVAYFVIVALLTAIFYLVQLAWAEEIRANLDTLLLWKPLDDRLLYANWIASGLGAAAAPMFYFARRAKLHSDHRQQIRNLKEFASTDPDRLIHQPHDNRADQESAEEPATIEGRSDGAWYAVLGVSPSATAEEVKQAYKAQIKQSHPDRVHDMSPIFRQLAESETKRLNAAYEDALLSLRPLEFEHRASRN